MNLQREKNLRLKYDLCPAGKKQTLVKIRNQDQPIVIHFRGAHWDHMDFNHPTKSHPRWTSKCQVPCRVVGTDGELQSADIRVDVWHDQPLPRPDGMKSYQRYAAFASEPYFGSQIPHNDLRRALLGSDSDEERNGTGYVDLVVSWIIDKNEYDFPLTYGYASEIPDNVWLDGNVDGAMDRVKRYLASKYTLPGLPPFNKKDFFGSLPKDRYPSALDRRGGDVVLVVSNCRADIWRTEYLRLLIDLLAKPRPDGYGLTVDSYGACHGRIGWYKDDLDVNHIKAQGESWEWQGVKLIADLKNKYPGYYPWEKESGGFSNGFAKNELVRHYKVFLDFESNLVHGYITEKFFQVFLTETIAIYFGPPSHEMGDRWPPASTNSLRYKPNHKANIIDGWEFPDPRDMAREINDLCTNETKWHSYFEWRVAPDKRGSKTEQDKEFVVDLSEDFIQLHAHSEL